MSLPFEHPRQPYEFWWSILRETFRWIVGLFFVLRQKPCLASKQLILPVNDRRLTGHVERCCGFDSFHSSPSFRSETGCLGECGPTPPTGRVQTQRSAAKTEQSRSIVLDRPVHDFGRTG